MTAAGILFCYSCLKTLRLIWSQVYYIFFIYPLTKCLCVIYADAKIIGMMDMFLHHLLLNNEASIPQRFNGTWTMSKMTWGANKYAKLWANINEGIFFNVFCWLRCLSKWGVGPLKRGSHLSAQGQQSCSGQPHCASLIVKNLRRFCARIWSGWGNCRLSATVMTQSF